MYTLVCFVQICWARNLGARLLTGRRPRSLSNLVEFVLDLAGEMTAMRTLAPEHKTC